MAIQSDQLKSASHKKYSYGISYFISLCDMCYGLVFQPEILIVLFLLIVILIVLWHQVLSIFMNDYNPTTLSLAPSEHDGPGSGLVGYKFILIWSGCFGVKDCGWGGSSYFFKNAGCPEHRCMVITDRRQLSKSDVVIFHVRDMRFILFTLDVPTRHDPSQVWVFFSHESPYSTYVPNTFIHSTSSLVYLDGMFNATMTYMRESDFFLPYITYAAINQTSSNFNLKLNKTRLTLWLVSNCRSDSGRAEYVTELKKYIKVDVFGDCGDPDPCKRNNTCVRALIQQYKFYLAFENAECRDYITEKFWRSLDYGVVPVVLGAAMAEYEALAPPSSFIHVDNFTSIKALADYLLYLDQNPAIYNKYLEWKRNYEITGRASQPGLCHLCAVAHNKSLLSRHPYKISEWYSVKRLCRKTERVHT